MMERRASEVKQQESCERDIKDRIHEDPEPKREKEISEIITVKATYYTTEITSGVCCVRAKWICHRAFVLLKVLQGHIQITIASCLLKINYNHCNRSRFHKKNTTVLLESRQCLANSVIFLQDTCISFDKS